MNKKPPAVGGEISTVGIKYAPSLVWNNLTLPCHSTGSNVVHRVKPNEKDSITLYGIQFIEFGNVEALFIGMEDGFQVRSVDGSQILVEQKLPEAAKKGLPSGRKAFCAAVTALATGGQPGICVGTSNGTLLQYAVADSALSNAKVISKHHTGFVTYLMAKDSTLVSADSEGNVVIWSLFGSDMNEEHRFNTDGRATTGICCIKDTLVTFHDSGHMRLFSIPDKYIFAEVAAHAKCVSAFCVLDAERGEIATTSEDTAIMAWKIPQPPADDSESDKVNVIKSFVVNDAMMTGLGVASRHSLMAVAYDYEKVFLMKYQ